MYILERYPRSSSGKLKLNIQTRYACGCLDYKTHKLGHYFRCGPRANLTAEFHPFDHIVWWSGQ
uniref:Uncharacterized protein n=1 Tax=Arundo donax TaxID=35708 RepID=A0A0A9ACT1_ARUDO